MNGEVAATRPGRVDVPAGKLRPGENLIEVLSQGVGPVFATAALGYHTKTEGLGAESGGPITVRRRFQRIAIEDGAKVWQDMKSGDSVKPGEEVLVTVAASSSGMSKYVLLDAPIPAGTEAFPGDPEEDWWAWSGERQIRDDRVTQAIESLGERDATVTFRLRATLPGVYHVMPASAFEMYDPAKRGSSEEFLLRVIDEK